MKKYILDNLIIDTSIIKSMQVRKIEEDKYILNITVEPEIYLNDKKASLITVTNDNWTKREFVDAYINMINKEDLSDYKTYKEKNDKLIEDTKRNIARQEEETRKKNTIERAKRMIFN